MFHDGSNLIHKSFLEDYFYGFLMTGDAEFEDIITVVEGVPDPTSGPKRKLCAIRIYKKADSTPRPIIEIPDKEQRYFPYDIIKCFENVKEAHDYAEENGIIHVEF